MTVDVLIPVYKPDRRFARLLQMLKKQTVVPDRIIIMNTESVLECGRIQGYPRNGSPSSDKRRV